MLYTIFPTVSQCLSIACHGQTQCLSNKHIPLFSFGSVMLKKILAYFHLNYFIHFIKTRITQLTPTHSSIIMDRRAVSNFSRLMCCTPSVFSSNSWLRSQRRSPSCDCSSWNSLLFGLQGLIPGPMSSVTLHPTGLSCSLPYPLCCIYCTSGSNSLDGGGRAGGCGWSCEVTNSLSTR